MGNVLASGADERYGYHLLNLIGSIKANSDLFDGIVVYDLGLSQRQRRLVDGIRDIEVRTVPPFVPHWAQGRTWKTWIWTHLEADQLVWLDAGLTVLRPLTEQLEKIRDKGYFAVSQGHPNRASIPTDWYATFGLSERMLDQVQIAAGILGFRRAGPFYENVIVPTYEDCARGLSRGYSPNEVDRLNMGLDATGEIILRDCPLFRWDQSVLNAHFARAVLTQRSRDIYRFAGWRTPHDHPEQVIWNHRRRGDYRYLWRVPYTRRAAPSAWRWTLRFRHARDIARTPGFFARGRTPTSSAGLLAAPHEDRLRRHVAQAGGKGIARFQREFLRAAADHALVEELDVFVPEQPDEVALPAVAGWRYHRVPTRPMVVWEQFRLPEARTPARAGRRDHRERAVRALGAARGGLHLRASPPPGAAQPGGRHVSPAAARRLDDASCSSGSRCGARRSCSRPPSRLRATSPRSVRPRSCTPGSGPSSRPAAGHEPTSLPTCLGRPARQLRRS